MSMHLSDFNELPSHVWPRNARRNNDGTVTIAGVALPDIVAEHGTPVMVFDEDDFRSRCRDMAQAFHGAENVHYASKAMLSTRIVRWVKDEGLSLDVASLNELLIALRAGFPAERITVHGNTKNREFLHHCVAARVGHVVLDAPGELVDLNEIAAEMNQHQSVLVRVTPGVDAHTHEFIATSHEDQKFGFSLAAGDAWQAVVDAHQASNLDLDGIHCHVGSQVFDADGFTLAADRLLELFARVHQELGVQLPILDLGGGYGVPYLADDSELDIAGIAADLIAAVNNKAAFLGIDPPQVVVEPGRALVGPAAVTVYEVGADKNVQIDDDRYRRYLAVDGGMSDNIRPALYGADYDARVVSRFTDGHQKSTRLVGAHCESGDILIPDFACPADVRTGDLLGLAVTGAYCYPMSSRYNAFTRPAVVSVRDGRAELMLRRETIEDLLSLDVEPDAH
ncbi:diaminopimelate decarboxylase [Corynebacterium propinquum]|uniref:diaminopimelate decarboxylase n=1 Tax=Corynebacterium propinquum TaxID=43769 RepID=UPI002542877A|nr:diaminopimelate decarboxylase [Corynebacterium propinquum]MDK4302945.1 diaminopimelate decarboxylase [Corynebacterium propinquum]